MDVSGQLNNTTNFLDAQARQGQNTAAVNFDCPRGTSIQLTKPSPSPSLIPSPRSREDRWTKRQCPMINSGKALASKGERARTHTTVSSLSPTFITYTHSQTRPCGETPFCPTHKNAAPTDNASLSETSSEKQLNAPFDLRSKSYKSESRTQPVG